MIPSLLNLQDPGFSGGDFTAQRACRLWYEDAATRRHCFLLTLHTGDAPPLPCGVDPGRLRGL